MLVHSLSIEDGFVIREREHLVVQRLAAAHHLANALGQKRGLITTRGSRVTTVASLTSAPGVLV